jgi:RNA polymerase sigma-70 factor (ECF subfamily)
MDENPLIRQAREGDGDAFRALFDAHSGKVFGLAYRYLGNRSDAEDVLQETFIRAYQALGGYDPAKSTNFAVWVNRICINRSIDVLRRTRLRKTRSLEDPATVPPPSTSPDDDPERVARNREVRRRIDEALGRLSPRQRMVFTLRHDLGYTTREIADSIGSTEGSVKKHLFRAVDLLKRRLRRFAMENSYEL